MGSKYAGNKGLEYYKAYPRDFFEGTIGMTGPLRGFYRMVIDLIYMHDGFLLNDWGHISGNTGFGKTQCKRMMQQLVDGNKVQLSGENGEFFTQKRAKSELKVSRKFQEKQSNNGSWIRENKDLTGEVVQPKGQPKSNHHKTTRPQDKNPLGSTRDENKPKQRRAVQIPSNWVPSDKNIHDATGLGLSQKEIENEGDRFRDHCIQHGKSYKDFDAAWRNWSRNSIKFKARNGAGVARPTLEDEIANRATRYAERKASEREAGGDAGGRLI